VIPSTPMQRTLTAPTAPGPAAEPSDRAPASGGDRRVPWGA